MIPMAYKCKMCGREGLAHASDDGDPGWNATLAKMLVCNRCADYRQGRRKWGEAIASVCAQIRGAQLTKGLSNEAEDEARKQLKDFSQSYAHVACKYHHCQDIWEEEFVNLLVDKPDLCWRILREYEAGIPAAIRRSQEEMRI